MTIDAPARGRPITTSAGLERALSRSRERITEARMEVRAAGQEMRAAGLQIRFHLHNGPDENAIERTAASLIVRGERYARS